MKPKRQSPEPFYVTGRLLPEGMIYTLQWTGGLLCYGGYPYRFEGDPLTHDTMHVTDRTRCIKHWSAVEQIRKHFEKTHPYPAMKASP